MPKHVPSDPGKPNPRDALARVTAAAGPRVAKAVEAATPKVEKAASSAGKLLGTLRERARITAKEFSDAYTSDEDEKPTAGDRTASDHSAPADRPHPRPRPTKD